MVTYYDVAGQPIGSIVRVQGINLLPTSYSEWVFVAFTTQEINLVCISVGRMSRPQGGREDYANKNSIDTIGNRTRDLPTCSAVPQTAPPRALWLVYTTRIDVRAYVWPVIALSLSPCNKKCLTVT